MVQTSTDSDVIEGTAARYLSQRHGGDWTALDQVRFDEWLEASTAHRVAYIRLESVWKEAGRLRALGAGLPSGAVPPRGLHRGNGLSSGADVRSASRILAARGRELLLPLAAAVLLAIGVSLSYLHFSGERYTTPVGGLKNVSLADGSQVMLNTNTQIRVEMMDSERRIVLDRGEAYFIVAKDRSRPFIVNSGDKRVVAVGTQFSVRRAADDVEVVVTEGRVRLTPSSGKAAAPTALEAGAVARTLRSDVLVSRHSPPETEQLLSWRSGFLMFRDTPLAEAVAEFNRYVDDRLVIEDPKIAGLLIGGNFRSNNVEAFLWLLQKGFPVTVERDGDEVVLRGR